MTKPKLSPPWGLLSLKILHFDIKLVLIDLAFLFTRLKLFECIIHSWYTVSTSARIIVVDLRVCTIFL